MVGTTVLNAVTPFDRVIAALEAHTGRPCVGQNGTRMATCPAHDDRNPSLSVSEGDDGRVLICCHAGCDTDNVLDQLGLKPADLFEPRHHPDSRPPRPIATYDYQDEKGSLLFQVVRMEPKDFRQRRPDGKGGWEPNIKGVRRVPYRLPELIAGIRTSQPIYVTEGEKDADALVRAGLVATTNMGGAGRGKWRHEYNPYFTGANVIIVADRDDVGRQHALEVEAELLKVASRVRVVEPIAGKDVADHLAHGHTVDEFIVISDSRPVPELTIVSAAELVREIEAAPPVGWLVRGIWPADAHGILAAEQKAGKTWAVLDMAVAVAAGLPWLTLYPCDTYGTVLCFLGEGGKRKMKRRLDAICALYDVPLTNLPLRFCFRVPHLTRKEHLAEVFHEIEAQRPVLVIVDPLYLAARGAHTSQLNEMGEHLENMQHATQAFGAALVIVHHWNKTGEGKGARRMTGAGGAEWGRVLGSVSVRTKHTDRETRASSVLLDWEFEGDEIADIEFRIRRKVWADNPDDLNSPLHYDLEEVRDDDLDDTEDPDGYSPSTRRVLAILDRTQGFLTVSDLGDSLADEGRPLKKRTIQEALKQLKSDDRAVPWGDPRTAYKWRSAHWLPDFEPGFEGGETA